MAGINEFVRVLAPKLDVTQEKAKEIVKILSEEIVAFVRDTDDLNLVGFANFQKIKKEAGEATNPKDPKGPKIQVAAKFVFKVKTSKSIDMGVPAPSRRRG